MRFSKISNMKHQKDMKVIFNQNKEMYFGILGECICVALKNFLDNINEYKEKCLEEQDNVDHLIIQFDDGVSKSGLESILKEAFDIKELTDIVYSSEYGNLHYEFSFSVEGQRIHGYGDSGIGSLTLYCTFVK